MCLLKYVLNCEKHFSYFIFRPELSDIRINCDRSGKGLLYSVETSPRATLSTTNPKRLVLRSNPFPVVGSLCYGTASCVSKHAARLQCLNCAMG
jgi:hypothetical protein